MLLSCKTVKARKRRKRRGKATRGTHTKSCSQREKFGKKSYKKRFCRKTKGLAARQARTAVQKGTYKAARVKACKTRLAKKTTYCVYARKR